MTEKTVLDLVEEGLRAQGYDGLFNTIGGCACELCDLAPCGEMESKCIAGRKHIVTAEDVEAGRYDHFDDPPSLADVGKYWIIVP